MKLTPMSVAKPPTPLASACGRSPINGKVLCITHLAPVAAAAQTHYVVSKAVIDGRTESNIQQLAANDRVVEIARMLGGKVGAARKHAEELLG